MIHVDQLRQLRGKWLLYLTVVLKTWHILFYSWEREFCWSLYISLRRHFTGTQPERWWMHECLGVILNSFSFLLLAIQILPSLRPGNFPSRRCYLPECTQSGNALRNVRLFLASKVHTRVGNIESLAVFCCFFVNALVNLTTVYFLPAKSASLELSVCVTAGQWLQRLCQVYNVDGAEWKLGSVQGKVEHGKTGWIDFFSPSVCKEA